MSEHHDLAPDHAPSPDAPEHPADQDILVGTVVESDEPETPGEEDSTESEHANEDADGGSEEDEAGDEPAPDSEQAETDVEGDVVASDPESADESDGDSESDAAPGPENEAEAAPEPVAEAAPEAEVVPESGVVSEAEALLKEADAANDAPLAAAEPAVDVNEPAPLVSEPAVDGDEPASDVVEPVPVAAEPPPAAATDLTTEHIIDPAHAERFDDGWREVKAAFVDDPAEAVRQASALTGEAVEEVTAALTRLRETLDEQSRSTDETDTERLRVVLRGYGSLLSHILTR
jgi:hypothetical protein